MEIAEDRSQVSIVQMLVNAENANDTMKPKPSGDDNNDEATTSSEPTNTSQEVKENHQLEENELEEQVGEKIAA